MTAPAAQWLGVYQATVYNTADPLNASRVQLKIPQVLGTAVSQWALPLSLVQPTPTPAIGTTVHAVFLGGDPSHPSYSLLTQTPTLFASYDGQVAQDDPTGWWKLDDAAGATAVLDYSGNANNGTPANVTFQQPQSVASVPSSGFNGTSSGVTTSYNPASLTAFSVECWVNLNGQTQTGNPRLVSNAHSDALQHGFELFLHNGTTPYFVLASTTAHTIAISSTTVPATGWTHIAGTWDGSNMTLYVNGATAGSTPWAGPWSAGTQGLTIGTGAGYTGDSLNGLLNEVSVYSTALPASRVLAHYRARAQGVTAANIAGDTITASQIAAGTITANEIAAGTIIAGIVDGTTITGASIVADGGSGEFLAYSGTPALGNLIASISGQAGSDPYGNSYPQGLSVDVGVLSGVSITANSLTANPGPFLVYGNPGAVTVYLTGSGNWTAPAGVTSVFAEAWGGGGSGSGKISGGGAGGGEYAAEPALAVTPGHNYAYSVAAAVTGPNGSPGVNGNTTTFAGDSATVTAHGGQGGPASTAAGLGGTGSTNSKHFNGGKGGTGNSGGFGGGGGGGSAGPNNAGNAGGNGTGSAAGAGASAVPGGGPGGAGGVPTVSGSPGGAPGGGGGSGGASLGTFGGNGHAGQIRLTYVPSGVSALLASLASAAGTDPATGDAYPGPGLGLAAAGTPATLAGFATAFATAGDNLGFVSGSDGNAYSTGVKHVVLYPNQGVTSTSFGNVTGASGAVAAQHYRFTARIILSEVNSTGAPQFQFTCPSTTGDSSIIGKYFKNVGAGTTSMRDNVFSTAVTALSIGAGIGQTTQGQVVELEGDATFSAAGTLQLQTQTSASGGSFTINAVFLDLYPVA